MSIREHYFEGGSNQESIVAQSAVVSLILIEVFSIAISRLFKDLSIKIGLFGFVLFGILIGIHMFLFIVGTIYNTSFKDSIVSLSTFIIGLIGLLIVLLGWTIPEFILISSYMKYIPEPYNSKFSPLLFLLCIVFTVLWLDKGTSITGIR